MPRGVKPKGELRNENKYQSYKLDWGAIKKAISTQDYQDCKGAVTAEASMIEDRLISFLFKIGAFKDKSNVQIKKTGLRKLIEMWKQHALEPLEDRFLGDLHLAVSEWVGRRNQVVHTEKSLPGEEHLDPLVFQELVRSTAIDGVRVVKSVQNWYSREKGRRKREGVPVE